MSFRRFFSVLLVVALSSLAAAAASDQDLKAWVGKNVDDLLAIYRDFHTHPELSFHEERTATKLADELKKLGIETASHVGKTGVVGILRNGPGPVVMIRTDLDALPVTEATGLPYASQVRAEDKAGND